MPALFVWRNRRPARALWSGLFRVGDHWRTASLPAPSLALVVRVRSWVTPPRRRRLGGCADGERMVHRRATLCLRPGATVMAKEQ